MRTRMFGAVVTVLVATAAGESFDKFLIEGESCGVNARELSLCQAPELEAVLPPNFHTPHAEYEYVRTPLPGFLASGASSSSISANPHYRLTLAGESVAR